MKFEWVDQNPFSHEVIYTTLQKNVVGLQKNNRRPNWIGFTNEEFKQVVYVLSLSDEELNDRGKNLKNWLLSQCLPTLRGGTT